VGPRTNARCQPVRVRVGHTFHVHKNLRPVALAATIAILCLTCDASESSAWQRAVQAATRLAPEARIIVLDVSTGRLLAAHRLKESAHTLAAPGSTLKPLVLYSLIAAGRWNPERRIACDRRLAVAGRGLACSHPTAPPFDAREALAWSCNSYFAGVARTLAPGELATIIRPTGILDLTGLASTEAVAEFREPRNVDDEQLTLLGVEGVRVSPLELAEAYRWLALQMRTHPKSQASEVVRAGLIDSATFGMAGEAGIGAVSVAGKTGTAEGAATARTHGWFVGLAPAADPQVVIVVFEPAGRGADAAHIAGEILAHSLDGQRR
jgi:cell division protein FtsI/penicillin-binding protein 2